MDNFNTIGLFIRKVRRSKGISYEQLSSYTRLSTKELKDIEELRIIPDVLVALRTLNKMAMDVRIDLKKMEVNIREKGEL